MDKNKKVACEKAKTCEKNSCPHHKPHLMMGTCDTMACYDKQSGEFLSLKCIPIEEK